MTLGDAVQPNIRWTTVCLDCADAEELAAFYGRIFGWEVTGRDGVNDRLGGAGWITMRDPNGGVGLNFQAEEWYQPPVWPEEPGALTKMIHFELHVRDMDAAVAEVIAAGGSEGPQPSGRDRASLRVMLDPAGHPFCLFTG
ncbi:MAG: VOC family protein [Actinobacteria bacterium]|nr:VOC family protein [Actinomycetota bacterium]